MEAQAVHFGGDASEPAVQGVRRRLFELRQEQRAGEVELEALDRRRMALRDTMLRISGAVQVLEELLSQDGAGEQEQG